jgi:putative pyruvate formate lyase activating enzyme
LTKQFFADAVAWGRSQGAKNIQWVGGEPGIHLEAICGLMEQTPDLPPVVWKSNFYFTPQAFESLWDYVDIFVADFKFGNSGCAENLCGAADYVETVKAALLTVYRRNPRSLIVRHLLLPGHFDCCFLPILDWFADNIPEAMFSLRDGYLPAWQAKNDPLLGVFPDPHEAARAQELIQKRCVV